MLMENAVLQVLTRNSRTDSINRLVLLGGLCATVVLVVVLEVFAAYQFVPTLAACVLFVLAMALLLKRRVALMSPFTVALGTIAAIYGLRPLYLALFPNSASMAVGMDFSLFLPAMVLVLVFVLSILIGYFSRIGTTVGNRLSVPFPALWSERRVRLAILVLIVVSFSSYVMMVRSSGFSLSAGFTNPVAFRAVTSAEGAFYVAGTAQWSMSAIFFLTAILILKRGWTVSRGLFLLFLFACLAVFSIPYGTRGAFLQPIFGILWLSDTVWLRKGLSLSKLIPIVLAVLLFTGAYGVFRDYNSGISRTNNLNQTLATEGVTGIVERTLNRFDAFDFFVWTLSAFPTPKQGYLLGRSAVDFIVQPVPRSIWADKPSQTSAFLAGLFLPNYGRQWTPEFGLITELYVNFWIFGIVLGGVAFGVLVCALEAYLAKHRNNPSVLFLYAPVALLPMSWLMAGFNSSTTIALVMNIVFGTIVLWFVGKRKTK